MAEKKEKKEHFSNRIIKLIML